MEKQNIKLTEEEVTLIESLMEQTKMNCWFNLKEDEDGFAYVEDLEFGEVMALTEALMQANEGIEPDLVSVTDHEKEVYASLMKRLGISYNPFSPVA